MSAIKVAPSAILNLTNTAPPTGALMEVATALMVLLGAAKVTIAGSVWVMFGPESRMYLKLEEVVTPLMVTGIAADPELSKENIQLCESAPSTCWLQPVGLAKGVPVMVTFTPEVKSKKLI